MRINVQTGFFEQGLVYPPVQAPWIKEYKKELISFPKRKHDDQVDSTAQALEWVHEYGQEPVFLIYMKEECCRLYGDDYVRLMEERQAQWREEPG